jgi:hypothetical protein
MAKRKEKYHQMVVISPNGNRRVVSVQVGLLREYKRALERHGFRVVTR